jgi:hypothetical protein
MAKLAIVKALDKLDLYKILQIYCQGKLGLVLMIQSRQGVIASLV